MTVVIQASMGGSYNPTKDATDTNTQQLKSRIKELEGEIDELNHKYNEELRIERVRIEYYTSRIFHGGAKI